MLQNRSVHAQIDSELNHSCHPHWFQIPHCHVVERISLGNAMKKSYFVLVFLLVLGILISRCTEALPDAGFGGYLVRE